MEQNIQELWDNYERSRIRNWNTRRMRKKGTKEVFEAVVVENFPSLISDTKPQIWEAKKTPKCFKNAFKKSHTGILYS